MMGKEVSTISLHTAKLITSGQHTAIDKHVAELNERIFLSQVEGHIRGRRVTIEAG
jgi:hypothetical protein